MPENAIKKRKEILPRWIRFFAWLHLLSFTAIPVFIIGLFGEASLQAFGMGYSGSSFQIKAIWLTILCTMAGLTAVGILWGKDWAIKLGLPYAILALITSLVGFFQSFEGGGFSIPIDPFLLIPLISVLNKKYDEWNGFNEGAQIPDSPPVGEVQEN